MMRIAAWPAWLQWAVLAVGGLAAGQGLQALGLPAGLMVGPLILGAIFGLRGAQVRMPRPAYQAAQGIAGCLIALHIDPGILARAVELGPVLGIFVVLTFLAACATGLIAAAWTGIDREVAIWGFLPGMAGTVIAISHERGLDSRMVAFIQILRLMMVISSMVGVAMLLAGTGAHPLSGTAAPGLLSTLRAGGIAALGVAAARWLPALPAGASLVPLTLAAGLSVAGVNIAMPGWLVAAAFLGLGLQIGLRFTPELMRTGLRALPALVAASLLLILFCAGSGLLLSWIADVDPLSALLATVPGSIDSIAIIAIGAEADVAFVMTLQTIRLFAVALLGPMAAMLFLRLLRPRPPAD
ncbi:AbrB family transcriptional regulator [Cereibacter sphaeroides]|uniref:AbrB family transcriptional regulator n=1 Tax=Cereibacter sphaeroides TaxID=1063 RepID=UPI00313D9B8C